MWNCEAAIVLHLLFLLLLQSCTPHPISPFRVVLMEQDMPHRISAPSRDAPGPRYSLVWKLVFVPKDRPAGQQQQGQQQGHEPAAAPPYQSICRPEWGEPVRIGSANARAGTPAFQR